MCISRLWDWDLWIEDQPVHSPLSIGRTVHLLREYCALRGVEVSEGSVIAWISLGLQWDLCSVAFTATAVRGRAKFVQLFNECIRLAGSYRPLPLLILPLSVPPSLCRSISVFLSLPPLLSLSLVLPPLFSISSLPHSSLCRLEHMWM